MIEQAGYGQYFTTRLGHGIGYEEHEAPDIKKSNPRLMERNIAFSIEPGIYIDGRFGVRIEDICAITKDGLQVLNQASKELIIISVSYTHLDVYKRQVQTATKILPGKKLPCSNHTLPKMRPNTARK